MIPLSDTSKAVLVIICAVAALAMGDALIRQSSASISVWQMFALRSGLAIPVILAIMALFARGAFHRPRRPGWTILRSGLMVLMWVFYYAALPHVPLSVAAAGYYTSPLFITLLAALVTGMRITPMQLAAVGVGFVGVLLIIRPGSSDLSIYAVLPIASAILYALAMILTATRCRDEHPVMLALALNIAFVVAGAVAMLAAPAGAELAPNFAPGWIAMTPEIWRVMGILAVAILIGSLGAAYAYQKGPAAVVVTFDFAYVGFSALWGWLIFLERPDALSSAGIALIVLAGLMALRR